MINKTFKRALFRIPITIKMVIITVFCGAVVYAVLDLIFTDMVKYTFIVQLNENLKDQAQEARIDFNNYVKAHYQLVKLFIKQKAFADYLDRANWFSETGEDVVYHTKFPQWFLPASILRTLANPRIVILFDSRGNAREVYRRPQDSLPQYLLKPPQILLEKSYHKNHLTNIDGTPFLITSELAINPQGRRITLMLASQLDDEFLILSQRDSPNRLLALLSSDSKHILTSDNLELLPAGTHLEKVKDRYLITGEEDYEYGDSEVVLNLVSFLSTKEAEAMADNFVSRGRQQGATMAFMLIVLSAVIMFLITRRIGRLTKNISKFSQEALGGKQEQLPRGDEMMLLENRFQLLTEEIFSSHKIIRKDSEEKALKKAEFEMKEGLYKMLQSATDAIGVGVLTKQNDDFHAANKQMGYFTKLCGGSTVFDVVENEEQEKTITDKNGDNGIIKQHDGHIEVFSEPGQGAIFEIYLPIYTGKDETTTKDAIVSNVFPGGHETVLLAEDDADVRNLTKSILENHGYSVIEAKDGEDAVSKFRQYQESVDLLLTDVIMPKKDGKAVYNSIKAIKPQIKALFMSGYTADRMHQKGVLEDGLHFMFKPVTTERMLKKVREVLDTGT